MPKEKLEDWLNPLVVGLHLQKQDGIEALTESLDPGIWYFGGGTANARFTSRVLAMQIAADVRGKPFVPYTASP